VRESAEAGKDSSSRAAPQIQSSTRWEKENRPGRFPHRGGAGWAWEVMHHLPGPQWAVPHWSR